MDYHQVLFKEKTEAGGSAFICRCCSRQVGCKYIDVHAQNEVLAIRRVAFIHTSHRSGLFRKLIEVRMGTNQSHQSHHPIIPPSIWCHVSRPSGWDWSSDDLLVAAFQLCKLHPSLINSEPPYSNWQAWLLTRYLKWVCLKMIIPTISHQT